MAALGMGIDCNTRIKDTLYHLLFNDRLMKSVDIKKHPAQSTIQQKLKWIDIVKGLQFA